MSRTLSAWTLAGLSLACAAWLVAEVASLLPQAAASFHPYATSLCAALVGPAAGLAAITRAEGARSARILGGLGLLACLPFTGTAIGGLLALALGRGRW